MSLTRTLSYPFSRSSRKVVFKILSRVVWDMPNFFWEIIPKRPAQGKANFIFAGGGQWRMGAGKGHGAADFLFPAKSRFPVNRSIFLQIASQTCRSLSKNSISMSRVLPVLTVWGGGSPSNLLIRIGGECRSGNIFDFERGGAMSAWPFPPGASWNAGFAAVWRQKAFPPAILRRRPP